ncbi:hypothetical protein TcG_08764, partial [Trypanosoma cruzi]
LAAEGTARPAQHRSCRAPSITPQHRSRRQQHAARKRKPTPPRVRPEGDTSAVVFRGGTLCGTVACPKPPRGVRTRHRALAAESLFPTQADGCAMTPQQNEAFVLTMEG